MIKTYDSTLQAYTEHPPKNHDATLNAWIDSLSAKTFDTAQNAWVEMLYKYWFRQFNLNITEHDDLNVEKSSITMMVDASYNTSARNAIYLCTNHDIKTGDTIEVTMFATQGIYVSLYLDYYMAGGVQGGLEIFSHSASSQQENKTISKVISASGAETWGNLRLSISYGYNTSYPYQTVSVADIKVNGKKYGFKEV